MSWLLEMVVSNLKVDMLKWLRLNFLCPVGK